jgi:hypothetical protein
MTENLCKTTKNGVHSAVSAAALSISVMKGEK